LHGQIHKRRIEQRAIGGQPDDDVGPGFDRRLVVSIKYVGGCRGNAICAPDNARRIVRRFAGRGDDQVVNRRRSPGAIGRADEHRYAGDIRQHLAGKPRRPHARLQDGNDTSAGHCGRPRLSAIR
jgi:hypothetical protein